MISALGSVAANYDHSQSTRTDTNRATNYQYDPATGLRVGERDPLGRWASTRYDALGRPITVTQNCADGSGTPVATGCAAYGAAHPDRNVADGTQYDALGRAYQTTDPLGRVAHTDYDGLGRVTAAAESLALPPGGGGPGGHAVVHADTSGVGTGAVPNGSS